MPRHFTTIELDGADPRLCRLTEFWQAGRPAPDLLPKRAIVDPLQLRDLLGRLTMVDVLRQDNGQPRFRYRLFGTGYNFYHGRDMTGKFVDEVAAESLREDLLKVYAIAANTAQPGYYAYDYAVDMRLHRFQAALLPLAEDGAAVDTVLTCAVPLSHDSP